MYFSLNLPQNKPPIKLYVREKAIRQEVSPILEQLPTENIGANTNKIDALTSVACELRNQGVLSLFLFYNFSPHFFI